MWHVTQLSMCADFIADGQADHIHLADGPSRIGCGESKSGGGRWLNQRPCNGRYAKERAVLNIRNLQEHYLSGMYPI